MGPILFGEKLLPVLGIEPRILGRQASSLSTIPTELSRLKRWYVVIQKLKVILVYHKIVLLKMEMVKMNNTNITYVACFIVICNCAF
jgi:hypothetical protein